MRTSILSILISFFALPSLVAQPSSATKNQSPYFHVTTAGISSEQFPLLSTRANVNITGPIADVTITQTYKNDGDVPIEAIYVFPSSTRAAVYAMTMRIGERLIKAQIDEKNKARQTYERAKQQGKRTSLLEQFRPNVFQMNVGNILPGDVIKVELQYNEFLIPQDKVYNFVYPTVVGPRFADPQHGNANSSFVNSPYSKKDTAPTYDFDLQIELDAGMELGVYQCPSHCVNIDETSPSTALISLDKAEHKSGNKDFIFNYSLANNNISKGTFLYDHGDEQFFLTMIEPPRRIPNNAIPPREYLFVMDVSGSMNGFPIEVSKKLIKDLLGNLKPDDTFNVLLFASSSKVFAEQSVAVTPENLAAAFEFISHQRGGGGTRLLPALQRALAMSSNTQINSRSIVVVTDGFVHVERETFELIANNLNESNLFAFGIGKSVNRHIIEGMAHAGLGEAFIVTNQKYAAREADRFRKYIQTPVLTNIEIDFEGFDAYDVSPASIPDLLAERPIYVFGKYRGAAKGNIQIKGYQGNRLYKEKIKISRRLKKAANHPIRYLWAREKIRWLNDLNGLSKTVATVNEVTALGLKYNLLTDYTSFVAVEENQLLATAANAKKEPPAKAKPPKVVKQVLPLPEGVSNYAIGFELKIDEVIADGQAENDSQLFVHISGKADTAYVAVLKKTLTESVVFTPEERSFLNSNTLEIQYDLLTDRWVVSDTQNRLTEAFVQQFAELLHQLEISPTDSLRLKINLLWV